MKIIIATITSICFAMLSFGQYEGILPFETQNGYFKIFYKGAFQQLEYQKVKSFQSGDNIVGYVDTKGDLKVYSNGKSANLAPLQNGYIVSDNFLVMNVGNVVSAWSQGKGITLTNYGDKYIATDSLVVFEDTQRNAINVYYNGQIIPLYAVIGDLNMPKNVGDNTILYNSVGMYYVFYHGKSFELDSWQEGVLYDCGRDIVAFNDPVSYTFAIFENGQFMDLDSFHAKEFKCGIQCVTFVDNNGNLQYYSHGEKKTLSNFSPDYWEAKDYMVAWGENSYFYVWDGKNKIQAATYKPEKWIIKNNVVAFKNQMGGVSCVINGKVVSLYTGPTLDFDVRGSSVIISLPNFTFLVYYNGKKYNS